MFHETVLHERVCLWPYVKLPLDVPKNQSGYQRRIPPPPFIKFHRSFVSGLLCSLPFMAICTVDFVTAENRNRPRTCSLSRDVVA
jgi:hypothetical protein